MSSLAKNSLIHMGGKLLGTAFGLATFYALLSFFADEGYGVFSAATTYVSLFAVIVDFGLTLTANAMIAEDKADEEKIMSNLLTLRVLSATLFLALPPITALFIPTYAPLFPLIALYSGASILSSVSQAFVGIFQKRMNLTPVVIAETAGRAIGLVGVVAAGFLSPSLFAATIAFVLASAVHLLLIFKAAGNYVRLRPAFDFTVWKDIAWRSWPIGMSIFFNLLYLKGDIFFMSIFAISHAEIGQYSAAYKVLDVITMIPMTFMGLSLPLLTKAWSSGDTNAFSKHLQNGFDVFAVIAIPFALGSIMLGVPVMLMVKPYLSMAGMLLAVLGPTALAVFYSTLYGHAVVALNKQAVMTFAYVAVAIFAVAGYVFYIPTHGAWAAAWVTLLSETFIALLTGACVMWISKTVPNLKITLQSILATAAMGAAIVLVPLPHVLLDIALGICVYVLALSVLGGPNPKTLWRVVRG